MHTTVLQTRRIWSKLLPAEFIASCFGVCVTPRALQTATWLGGRRLEAVLSGMVMVHRFFFLEQHFMCVVLTQPEGSPSMRNLVPTKTSTTQHRVQLESSPLDSPHQHNGPLHLQLNLARFGFCPPTSTMGENWEIKHLRDLPDFMFPEKQYVGLRVFWPCTASVLGGMW